MACGLTVAIAIAGCRSNPSADSPTPSQVLLTAEALAAIEAPAGMVVIPGGYTDIGADDGMPEERPIFEAAVRPFLLDRQPVTVADFQAFVDSTNFVTQAEEFGDAGLLVDKQWALVPGASWRTPRGPAEGAASDDHPVTQVSWNDAEAFCQFVGKRLPTEIEWEHAARGANNNRQRYAWGDELADGGRHKANTWQGSFPEHNRGEDGFLYTSPVGTFGETPLGLVDMGGNVWEWTSDWFRPYGPAWRILPVQRRLVPRLSRVGT